MAINQNHTSEELNGVRCAVADKNVTRDRASFLQQLLEFNKYRVELAATPPPKAAPAKPLAEGETAAPPPPPPPETFTVGVTDLMFNPINAIFGRLLHTPDGHVVTQAYWYQKEKTSHDEIPYYEVKK
ncbi:MAG TPA: hypothetical protein DIC22_05305 [Chitinophagaceae bacterium]|jgi:hypothetical protein|nr:hypothetical protein [Chitinophagaceae bacterium]